MATRWKMLRYGQEVPGLVAGAKYKRIVEMNEDDPLVELLGGRVIIQPGAGTTNRNLLAVSIEDWASLKPSTEVDDPEFLGMMKREHGIVIGDIYRWKRRTSSGEPRMGFVESFHEGGRYPIVVVRFGQNQGQIDKVTWRGFRANWECIALPGVL